MSEHPVFDFVEGRVYLTSDDGAWRSADGGLTWQSLKRPKPAIPDSLIEAALAKLQADGDPEDFYSSVLIPAPEAAELSYALIPSEWAGRRKLSRTRRELLWALRKLGRKKREADLRCAALAAENTRLRAAGNALAEAAERAQSWSHPQLSTAITAWRALKETTTP
jgi:hypothetical protein